MSNNEQARLKSIVETPADGIGRIDEKGDVESFNPAAERMFGYAAATMIGENVSRLMPQPYHEHHDHYLRRYRSMGEARIIGIGREVLGRRNNSTTFPMRLSVGEFQMGERRMFTGIAHDLTEQKQAEERAMQTERLAAIGQMVAVLSHESSNSLQLSQANLEMLCLEIEDRPEALEYASRIQTAQDRLQRLLEELREFAAPICLDREPYNLRSLVGQVLNELSAVHDEKQIRLREQAAGVDLCCAVDVFRMHQVFRNVLENSIAAAPDPVRISVTWVSTELNGSPALQVVLRDNGPGLSVEQKQKVFEPFYTTKKRGTGLGMAITRRIVEAHDGQIAVRGNGGEGAEFVITLPRGSAVQNNRPLRTS
jgi:two-component system sensor kinase FixL